MTEPFKVFVDISELLDRALHIGTPEPDEVPNPTMSVASGAASDDPATFTCGVTNAVHTMEAAGLPTIEPHTSRDQPASPQRASCTPHPKRKRQSDPTDLEAVDQACNTDPLRHQLPITHETDTGGSATQSQSKSKRKRKRKSKRKAPDARKRKEDNCKSRLKKRRVNDANAPFGGHINPPSKSRIAATQKIHTDADVSELPFCQGAFRGKRFPRDPRDVWTLERLQRENYRVLKWDGRCISIPNPQTSHRLTMHRAQVRASPP